ncbi:ABC transporter substrate-binding protein [Ottowia testudinis]|uniref:ABC transporter substrate-binding protein n=1 Tax=Ottowia testudinis TaxID=2816950 RepID=A0A975H3Z7_9BURK|nr:ABC transporter substrate-binding protein [Ottowia testudinis]QTD45796.1 ABC transporter substrate-binding protein [Ottowia testudinis]
MPQPTRSSRRRFLYRACALGAAGPLAWPLAARAQTGPVLIGQSLPLSGPMAGVFAGVLAGEKLAIDEYNQRQAGRNQPVELVLLDDAYDPRRTAENAGKFVEQKVAAMFGTVGTAQTAAALKVLTPARMPLIASYTGTPALRTDDFPLYFTTQANYLDESVRIIRHLTTVAHGQVAVLYQDDAFGKSMLPLVQKAAAEAGATVVATQAMEPSGKNAAEAVQAVAQARPQSVVLLVAGPGVVPAIRALRRGVSAAIYTYSLAISAAAVEALGADAVGLAVVRSTPYPWSITQSLAKAFAAAAARRKLAVDYDHYLGYINGRVLTEAARAAGANPTPAAMAAAMEKLGKLDLGGYTLEYGPGRHHGSAFTEITILGPKGRYIR